MKKIIIYFIFSLYIIPLLIQPLPVFAQTSIIPEPTDLSECTNENWKTYSDQDLQQLINDSDTTQHNILGCAIKLGRVKLWMIPYFLKYAIEFATAVAGTICMLFIVIGGYYYAFGGLSEDKEKGKKTVMSAVIGLIVALMAWAIVNIVMYVVTF